MRDRREVDPSAQWMRAEAAERATKPERNQAEWVARWVAISVVGFISVVVIGATIASGGDIWDKAGDSGTPLAEVQWSAEEACKRAVKLQLKAPAGAKFSGVDSAVVNDEVTVVGSVDSQNSFGAMLRSSFSCEVRHDPTAGTYRVVNATVL